MLRYKFKVLAALKENGYSTAKLRNDKLIGEATIQNLRSDKPISWQNIDNLCRLLHCQPGDLLEYVEDEGTQWDRIKDELHGDKYFHD